MNKEEILKKSASSTKEVLDTIPLTKFLELEGELLSEDELMARAGDCEMFYTKHFEKVLDMFLLEELKYLGGEAQNDYMLLYSRGHIEMINKLKNWFIQQKSLSLSRFKKEDEPEGML